MDWIIYIWPRRSKVSSCRNIEELLCRHSPWVVKENYNFLQILLELADVLTIQGQFSPWKHKSWNLVQSIPATFTQHMYPAADSSAQSGPWQLVSLAQVSCKEEALNSINVFCIYPLTAPRSITKLVYFPAPLVRLFGNSKIPRPSYS